MEERLPSERSFVRRQRMHFSKKPGTGENKTSTAVNLETARHYATFAHLKMCLPEDLPFILLLIETASRSGEALLPQQLSKDPILTPHTHRATHVVRYTHKKARYTLRPDHAF